MQERDIVRRKEARGQRPVLIAMVWLCACAMRVGEAEEAPPRPQTGLMIKAWSEAEGLPHTSVTALAQTPDGYLWIGTLAGLVRFDGVQFRVFTPANCPELPRSRIGHLFEGADGTLFVATERGGGLVALREGRFERLLGAGNEQDEIVAALSEASGGSLFVARSGALWRWAGGRLTVLSSNREFYPVSARHVCEDDQGRVWMLSGVDEARRLVRFEGGQAQPVALPGDLAESRIRAVARDAGGQIWLGTSLGLAVLRGEQFERVELPELGLNLNVTDLVASRDGGLWVCGTNHWQRKCEDHTGSIWAGTSSAGIYRFQGPSATRYGPGEMPLTEVWSIFEDSRSNLWVGTSSHGVYQFRDGRFVSIFDQSRISHRVNAIHEDRRGRIWFGHWGGLACYADGQLSRVAMPRLSDDYEVVAMASDGQERLWLGTKGAGLFCLRDGEFTAYTKTNGLLCDLAWSLYVDPSDTLWIGTADGGLSCLRDGRFVHFTTEDGLAAHTVCHILEDFTGRFWFSSPRGVFSAPRASLETFRRGKTTRISCTTYSQSDGMLSAACTCAFQPSGCMTRDGRLLFPTLKGVAVLRPDAVPVESPPPPVFIERVAIAEKVYELTGPATLTAPPGRSRLEIRNTALNFSAPEKLQFRHRLAGLDSTWVNSGAKRVVDYSYLPHGRYRFEVQACNSDGLWSPQSASLELIIPPYLWQTRWFVGIVLLAGAGSIAFTARRLEKAKSRRRLEREQQARLVELERARIARDFHDDIGSDLTHVIVLSELLKADTAQPKEVEASATMIGNTARKAVRGLRTIIWAANPQNDTLDSLVQYISHSAYELCEAAPLSCHLDLPTEVPVLPLIAEVRHNLFMVVKEALHNILKHAHASEVRLGVKLHEGFLELRVEDNGRGFEVDGVAAGQRRGLANMLHRMAAIGATLSIESLPGAGTPVRARWAYPKDWSVGAVREPSS